MEDFLDAHTLASDDSETSARSRVLEFDAKAIVSKSRNDPEKLPDVLLELLNTIIKPLFNIRHPQITPAGRKPAYAAQPTLPHAVPTSLYEEEPWKIPLTVPLLQMILKAYPSFPQPQRRQVLETQFPLLIPPILNITDDISASSKADGYSLLYLLCDAIVAADSNILKRTGLTDVFIDTIKPNFMLLPTLTPEDEAQQVLEKLYPAFLALMRARFDVTQLANGNIPNLQTGHTDDELRQTHLKLVLRHGLLASLSHLDVENSISYISLTTLLVAQLGLFVEAMGLNAAAHLSTIMPMIRSLLVDPFVTAAPKLLLTTLKVMSTLIKVCTLRIGHKWWPECLRGLVGCWCNILDQEEDTKIMKALDEVKREVVDVTKTLSHAVDNEEWAAATAALCEEAEDLRALFGEERAL